MVFSLGVGYTLLVSKMPGMSNPGRPALRYSDRHTQENTRELLGGWFEMHSKGRQEDGCCDMVQPMDQESQPVLSQLS